LLPAAAPPVLPVAEALPTLAELPMSGPAVFIPFPGGGIFFPGGGGPGGGGGGPGGGGGGPGGGGGGPPPPPPPPPPPTPTPFSAVPEPGTWAMMLLGFGMIGLTLRRRRAAEGSTFAR
jgi:hypothetical protein